MLFYCDMRVIRSYDGTPDWRVSSRGSGSVLSDDQSRCSFIANQIIGKYFASGPRNYIIENTENETLILLVSIQSITLKATLRGT